MTEMLKNGESLRDFRAKLNAAVAVFPSKAAFEATDIPADVTMATVLEAGFLYRVTRGPGSWETVDGGFWSAILAVTDLTRAQAAVALATSWTPKAGQSYLIGGLVYVGAPGSTAIADMPGMVPGGQVVPDHWMTNASPGVTDMSAAIQSAVNHLFALGGGTLRFPSGTYRMVNCVELRSNVSLDFSGARIVAFGVLGRSNAGSLTLDGETINYNPAHELFFARGQTNLHVVGGHFDMGGQNGWLSPSRLFSFIGCRDYSVRHTTAIVPGAFIASQFGRDYAVTENRITVVSSDGLAKHDGIIDQWWLSSNFEIHGNVIFGRDIGLWGILITATDTLSAVGKECRDFIVTANRVEKCRVGLFHAMGRYGFCRDFVVLGNIFEDAPLSAGAFITDCDRFSFTGNLVRRTHGPGIILRSESAVTYGDNGANRFTLSGNTVIDANLGASVTLSGGSAISLFDASGRGTLGPNTVLGNTHTSPYFFNGSTGLINLVPGYSDPGTVSTGSVAGPGVNGLTVQGQALDFYVDGLRMRKNATALQLFAQATELQEVRVGANRVGDGQSQVVMTSATGQSSLSLTSFGGADGTRELRTRGNGVLRIVAQDVAPVTIGTQDVTRMRVESSGRVSIGEAAAAAAAGAALDVQSTTGGLLFPRLSTTQRDAITTPPDGLVIYNTITNKLQTRAGGAWVDLH